MSSSQRLVSRVLLACVFAGVAALKARHFLVDGDWQAASPFLQNPGVMTSVIALEALVAILFLTRFFEWASWGAIVVAVGGNFVYLAGLRGGQTPTCGCLGRVPVTPLQHAALACAVFALAAVVLTQTTPKGSVGSRSMPTR